MACGDASRTGPALRRLGRVQRLRDARELARLDLQGVRQDVALAREAGDVRRYELRLQGRDLRVLLLEDLRGHDRRVVVVGAAAAAAAAAAQEAADDDAARGLGRGRRPGRKGRVGLEDVPRGARVPPPPRRGPRVRRERVQRPPARERRIAKKTGDEAEVIRETRASDDCLNEWCSPCLIV